MYIVSYIAIFFHQIEDQTYQITQNTKLVMIKNLKLQMV